MKLERLLGIHDPTFQATFTERTGRNLSDDAGLETLQLVQEVFGRGQTVRLTQFWFDQKIEAWYNISSASDVVSDINGTPFAITGLPPLQRRSRLGGYIGFSQQLTPLVTPNSKVA